MIKENLQRIKEQMPASARLVAVSKYRPLADLQQAYDAGQRVFAESRPQEFAEKVKALPEDIQWHFIGHLQTNKLKLVLPYADLIHSVDSLHLLQSIQDFCKKNSIKAKVLIEVHIGAEETKQGFTLQETEKLFSDTEFLKSQYPDVSILGLMGMASHTEDAELIDDDFERIESLFLKIRDSHPEMQDFKELSIGMSDDWEIAVRHSATMIRVGSAIFNNGN